MEGPVVAPSAHRHGVDDAAILHAFDNPLRAQDLHDGSILLFGPDYAGKLFAIGVVDSDEGPVIVHAIAEPETSGGIGAP